MENFPLKERLFSTFQVTSIEPFTSLALNHRCSGFQKICLLLNEIKGGWALLKRGKAEAPTWME